MEWAVSPTVKMKFKQSDGAGNPKGVNKTARVKRALNVYQNSLWKIKVPPSWYKVWRLHLESIEFPHCFQLSQDSGLAESKNT